MKKFHLLVAAMIVTTLAVVAVSAQTTPRPATTGTSKPAAPASTPVVAAGPVPDAKIAYIDTGAFGADGGITKYINAIKALDREFKPRQDELTTMQTRLKGISDEITKLSGSGVVDQKTIQGKQDEGERLQREIKFKKDSADADFAKRYEQAVGPVSTEIGKAIEQFAATRGITMVIDISKLAPAILAINPTTDVTQAFIKDYNSTHP